MKTKSNPVVSRLQELTRALALAPFLPALRNQLSFGKRPLWSRRIERGAWQLYQVLLRGLTAFTIAFCVGYGLIRGVDTAMDRADSRKNLSAHVEREKQSSPAAGLLPDYTNHAANTNGR